MCDETTSQGAGADALGHYLATGLEAVDSTTDGIIAVGFSLNDLPRLIPYLSALIEGAYQITERAVPLVKHATPERLTRLGLKSTDVYACVYHARDLLDAAHEFIEPIERELRVSGSASESEADEEWLRSPAARPPISSAYTR